MALFKRIFYRKPQGRLLEISERVYVFDCCFSTDVLDEDEYKMYMCRTVAQLQDHFPESSFMVFNFKEGERPSQISDILSEYDMTVMDYPRQYEGCPLLPLEMIHYYLRSSESWLSLEGQQNVLLMHCERGGWPILGFMLASLLIYRKQYSDEQRTLEMVYKQAPKALLQLLSPLNPQPSQLRYLQYISRRNSGPNWPPSDTPLFLDCLIIRVLPTFEGGKGCRPVIRVYGQDPKSLTTRSSKLLFSNSKTKTQVRHFRKEECALVKIDIHCHIQGDVVFECIHLNEDLVREEMIFRVMFHTAFVQENILVFYSNEIDTLWDATYQFPKDFRVEILFTDPNDGVLPITGVVASRDGHEIESVSKEEYFEVQEIFSNVVDASVEKVDDESPIVHDNRPEQKDTSREDENHLTIKDWALDDGNHKHDVKVDSSMEMVRDVDMDDVNYNVVDKMDYGTNAAKEIVNDNGDHKVDSLEFTVAMLRETKTKGMTEHVLGKSKVMENKGYREDTTISLKNSESKVLQQVMETSVSKPNFEEVLPALEKKVVPGSKSASNSLMVKPNSKQLESQGSVAFQWVPPNKRSYTASPTLSGSVALKESDSGANLLNGSNDDVIPSDVLFEQKIRKVDPMMPSDFQTEVSTTPVVTFPPDLQQSVSIPPNTLSRRPSSPSSSLSPSPTPTPSPHPPPPPPPPNSSLSVSRSVQIKTASIRPPSRSTLALRSVKKKKTSILPPPSISPSPKSKSPPPLPPSKSSFLFPRSVQKGTTSILPPSRSSLLALPSDQKNTTFIQLPHSLSPSPTTTPPPPPPPPPRSSLLVPQSVQKKATSILTLPPPQPSTSLSRTPTPPIPLPPPRSSLLFSRSVQKKITSILHPPSSSHSPFPIPTPTPRPPPPPPKFSMLVSRSVQKNATSILPLPLSSLLVQQSVQKKEKPILPPTSFPPSASLTPMPPPPPPPPLPPPRISLPILRSIQKNATSKLPPPSSLPSPSTTPTLSPPPPPPPRSSLLVIRSVQKEITSILPSPRILTTIIENDISKMSLAPPPPPPLPPNREKKVQNIGMVSQMASTSLHLSNNQTAALVFPPPPPPPWKAVYSSAAHIVQNIPPPPPPPTLVRSSKGTSKLSNFRPSTPSTSKFGNFRRPTPSTSKLGNFRPPPPSTPIQIAMALAFIHGLQSASPPPPYPQNGAFPPSSPSLPPPPPPPPTLGAPPLPPLTRHEAQPPPPPPPPTRHGTSPSPPPPRPPPPPPNSGAPPPPTLGGPPPSPPPIPGAPSPPMARAPPPPPPPGGRAPGPPPPPGAPGIGPPPPPPLGGKATDARGRGRGLSRSAAVTTQRRSPLKPLHWSKVTRAIQGSLWDELQRQGEPQIGSEFDVSELETLFSAAVPKRANKSRGQSKAVGSKPDVVHLVDLKRANNTEIMLTKVKMPFPDMMAAVLALDDSVLDADQVENLIKFCPTKEEMELLKGYTGEKETLGKCEQYFLELMKVPRVEAKLRVFSFKIQFNTQIVEFKKSLNTVNYACEEIRNSQKFKEVMKKILHLGNTLNQGTARGSAVGFKLDSLLKLHDTRASNSRMTLIHYLCKVIATKTPELLDFHLEFVSLEASTKIQLKSLAEEMQAIIKGLDKVKQELVASENDGPESDDFRKTLKEFTSVAETEGASLQNLYTVVGRNADALALYFGEDPARCPFEQVTGTLLKFVKLFQKAHEENLKQDELEKKKALKEDDLEKKKALKDAEMEKNITK